MLTSLAFEWWIRLPALLADALDELCLVDLLLDQHFSRRLADLGFSRLDHHRGLLGLYIIHHLSATAVLKLILEVKLPVGRVEGQVVARHLGRGPLVDDLVLKGVIRTVNVYWSLDEVRVLQPRQDFGQRHV